MFKCIICNRELGSKGISSHLRRKHNINNKDYYDTYLKKENDGKCAVCGKETTFYTILVGYAKYCSTSCLNLDPETRAKIENTNLERYGAKGNFGRKEISQKAIYNSQSEEGKRKRAETNIERYGAANIFASDYGKQRIKETNLIRYGVEYSAQAEKTKNNIRKTEEDRYENGHHLRSKAWLEAYFKVKQESIEKFKLENDCVERRVVTSKYGYGWYLANIVSLIKYKNLLFVRNSDIPIIEEYSNTSHKSNKEKAVVDFIKIFYDDIIIIGSRKIIAPYELDIYLPKLNLAIEYNGTFWHSQEANKPKDYHLTKSLLCREKGIRLIHIYEFEDINEQLDLLESLILGEDNYPKEDFNKNNLIEDIPKPEIIYSDGYIIYGAGKLY